MSRRRKPNPGKNGRPVGGGGTGNPRSLANLRPGAGAGVRGNARALKHGGSAEVANLARAGTWAALILSELEEEAPLRDAHGELPVHDRRTVEVLALCLSRLAAVTGWLDSRPPVDEKGNAWPAEETARRLRTEAAKLLDALGMSPTSRARLGLDLAHAGSLDLAQAMAHDVELEEREARVRARERELGLDGEAAGDA